jgi:hypothetical protein
LSPDVFSGNGYEPTDKINHRLDQVTDEGSGMMPGICSISRKLRVDLVKSD